MAIYHNLPPGGALRVLHEFVRRSHAEHEYHLYTVDLGPLDGFAYARERAEQHDLTPHVGRSYRYPIMPGAAARSMPVKAWGLTRSWWMDRMHRRIADDINTRGYDVALVNSCSITHSPSLLRYLEVPSLYYMQEPRRRSFEAGYQAGDAASRPHRAVTAGKELSLRRQDRAAALAAGRIACNSYYSAESIQRAYGRDAAVCYLAVDGGVFDVHGLAVDAGPTIMSVGALEAVKGHHLVVQAVALLPAEGRPAVDIVYERVDPVYRAELEGSAASAGVDLRLHAGIPDAGLAAKYRAATATVAAARLEPFGLVPLESMACGTPVVAVREAGYRETVCDGVNGYLVDRSVPEIAAGIARVVGGELGRSRIEIRRTVLPLWGWEGAVDRQMEQLALAAADRPRRVGSVRDPDR